MPYRTQVFNMIPWVGGYNTSVDPSLIGKNELTAGENIIFDTRGSRRQRPAINYDWDDQTSTTSSILGLSDFWFDSTSTKIQRIVAVGDDFSVNWYDPSDGSRTALSLDTASTQWGSVISTVSFETFNNKLIWAADGVDNKVMFWDGTTTTYANLTNAPEGSIVRSHLGRLWMNDKNNRDRLHYSETFDHTVWNGVGDSGALDIGVGDGDPSGIVAIFPSFKGQLFVAKRTKLYRILGTGPEDFEVRLVSSGIGCVSNTSIAMIDQDDIYFISERGVHSIVATDTFGDFEAKYISAPIQKTFNDRWLKSRLKTSQAVYIPTINSYLVAVTDDEYSSTVNRAIWCYNIPLQAWYLWPDVVCESIAGVDASGKRIFYVATDTKRVGKGLEDSENDTDESGNNNAILFKIATGFIFPTDNPYITCGFKKIGLQISPAGSFDLTIRFQIDDQEEQLLTLSVDGGEELGVDFILDQSILQPDALMQPAILSVDGYGRSFKLTVEQSSTNKNIEIQGFHVEYEASGPQQTSGLTESV